MKRWIKNMWDSTAVPDENREEFVPLEDDPVGALLERQRMAMSRDEMNPSAAESELAHTLSHQETELLPEDGESLVTTEKDPLQALAEEGVLTIDVVREEGISPAEKPVGVEAKSGAAVSSQETEPDEDVIESTEEVTVMTTDELKKQEAVPANTAVSESTPPESNQPAPDEPISELIKAEPEMELDSEDADEVGASEEGDTEDGESDSLLDIFREEETESNSIFSQGIDDISIDSLLDEANQIFNRINANRSKNS